MTLFKEVLSPG